MAYHGQYDIMGCTERLYNCHIVGWDDDHIYYYSEDGTMAIGKTLIDGKIYRFIDDGSYYELYITHIYLEWFKWADSRSTERSTHLILPDGWHNKKINTSILYKRASGIAEALLLLHKKMNIHRMYIPVYNYTR